MMTVMPVAMVVGTGLAASIVLAVAVGHPWPVTAYLSIIIGTVLVYLGLIFIPRLIMMARGYRGARMPSNNPWEMAFASRDYIEREIAYDLLYMAIPKPSIELYNWLGDDAYRVFSALSRSYMRTGGAGRFEVTRQLQELRDADLRDFDTLLGYFEVASIDASIYAVKEDIPIDYAKALFP